MTLEEFHDQLTTFARHFAWMRSFDYELRKATGRLSFEIRNEFAWGSVVRSYRMCIIEFSEWVEMLHQKGLKKLIQGKTLAQMKVSKKHATRLHTATPIILAHGADAATVHAIRASLVKETMATREAAMKRLFGVHVAARRQVQQDDVLVLCRKLKRRAEALNELRNALAHPFKNIPTKRIMLHHIAQRLRSTEGLLTDLGLLISDTSYGVPRAEARPDAHCRDLVDLILFGTIAFATKQWQEAAPGQFAWQGREVVYTRLRKEGRKNPSAPFNRFSVTTTATDTLKQAERTLTKHFLDDDGLAASLRPYEGAIKQADLDATRNAARSVVREAGRGAVISARVVARIFQLVKVVRITAVDPDSMLMRNKVVVPEHAALSRWVHDMEDALGTLLGILEDRET